MSRDTELAAQCTTDLDRTIGTEVDVADIDRRLGELDHPTGDRERAERTFVFCDIVDSTRLCEALGDDVWDGVLRWYERLVHATADDHSAGW